MNSIKNRIVKLELRQPSPRQQERLLARIERGRGRVMSMGGEVREWSNGADPALAEYPIAETIAVVRARVGMSSEGA